MTTAFGKKLRKIRVDKDMLLKDMADELKVSCAYLSSVENGKRDVPQEWIKKISKLYSVDFSELNELAFCSNKSTKINLSQKNSRANSMLYSFARKFDNLDDDEIEKISEILKKL